MAACLDGLENGSHVGVAETERAGLAIERVAHIEQWRGDARLASRLEMERVEARRKKLIEMVMDGVSPSVVRDELNANAARREQLEAQLAATEEPPPLLHPEMARIYRAKGTELAKALQEPDKRSEATEALRGRVDAIVLTSDPARERFRSICGGTWRRC
jgi:hypothetical protein